MSQEKGIRKFFAILILMISAVYGLMLLADYRLGIFVDERDVLIVSFMAIFGLFLYLSQQKWF